MSGRRVVDTNLIIRHLVGDNPRHAVVAARLFAACDRGELTLCLLPAVLAECVFVLESFYEQPRQKISQVLGSLITSPGVEIIDPDVHLDALHRFERTKIHFVDCVIAAHAVHTGLPVATFDRDFKKFTDVEMETS